ncbi:MAG: LysR family transcriptional regulator [Erysipelotrichaceae bacterium]|jgi:DNA-binding transcriptional LysR family regulator|nr:LysR family transcriptional regulator [Erysipelotrichaceae bacterium]
MNINQLKYFISVAENLSFSAAAQENYITQTAMTQQIRALEEDLGCILINRSTRPVSLTAAGESFLSDARLIVTRLNDAKERANEASSGISGTLRIGYIKGYERSGLSDALRQFHRSLPGVLLMCYRDTSDKLAASLQNGEYDIIFTWDSTNLRNDTSYQSIEIEKAHLMAALYASHPLCQREFLDRSDFKGESIIYMSPSELSDNYGDSQFLDLYRQAGYRPKILCRSTDIESILIMVAAEEGISIMPDYCVKKINNAEGLVFIPMRGAQEVEEIHAIYKKDNDNVALKHFLKQLKNSD